MTNLDEGFGSPLVEALALGSPSCAATSPHRPGMAGHQPVEPFAVRRDYRSPATPSQRLKPTHNHRAARDLKALRGTAGAYPSCVFSR